MFPERCVKPELLALIGLVLYIGPLGAANAAASKKNEEKGQDSTLLTILVNGQIEEGEYVSVAGADVYVESRDNDFSRTISTNPDGVAKLAGVPRSQVRVQVTAADWQTFGVDLILTKAEEQLEVTLKHDAEETEPEITIWGRHRAAGSG